MITEQSVLPNSRGAEAPVVSNANLPEGHSPVALTFNADAEAKEDEGRVATASSHNANGVSPSSENQSQASGASIFWKTLFEEDASIRTKRGREDSPKDQVKQQGRESSGK